MSELYAIAQTYPERNPPTVYIPIPSKAAMQLDDIKPGQEVHILLVGKLVSVTKRKPSMSWPGYVGEVSVECRQVAVSPNENAITEFLDDIGG